MEGFWPIFFLAVILKIPVAGLLYLVWWALHAEPELEDAPDDGDEHRFDRFRREPTRPRDPRRGPHAPDSIPVPDCPPGGRMRILTPPGPVRAGTAHDRPALEPERETV